MTLSFWCFTNDVKLNANAGLTVCLAYHKHPHDAPEYTRDEDRCEPQAVSV